MYITVKEDIMNKWISVGTIRIDEHGERRFELDDSTAIQFKVELPPDFNGYQSTQEEKDAADIFYINKWLRIHLGRK